MQNGNLSISDELVKLKELLDAGVLTQEEFDSEKQRLLNRDGRSEETPRSVHINRPPPSMAPPPRKKKRGGLVLLIIIIAVIGIGVYTQYSDGNKQASTDMPDTSAPLIAADNSPAIKRTETVGQKNALKSAKQYLAITAFSYTGLIRQLEFEQYSTEDATYAADNCGADWNEQAAKSAKTYLAITSFSRSGLIQQLEFEGFTHEQAVYGAEQNGY